MGARFCGTSTSSMRTDGTDGGWAVYIEGRANLEHLLWIRCLAAFLSADRCPPRIKSRAGFRQNYALSHGGRLCGRWGLGTMRTNSASSRCAHSARTESEL